MPIAELEKKWWGMNFNIAAEEMRRLKRKPTEEHRLQLYGLFKQAIHGDIPCWEDLNRHKDDEWEQNKYDAWEEHKGKTKKEAKAQYVKLSEEMIKRYHRDYVRCQWNADVWTVDY